MTKKASSQQIPERLDIRVDWAFHHFFRKKKHLIKIIKDLLDMDIQVIEYLPSVLDAVSEKEKRSVFDVICKNVRTQETFVLEMQTTYESDMMDRLYYYGGSLIHNQVEKGDPKYDVHSVLVCCIACYRVPHKESVPEGKVFFRYRMMENETHEILDGDKLNICFLELARFDNYLKKGSDLREQWCWIFNNLSTFVERPKNLDSSFDEVIKDADTSKLSADQRKSYMEARKLSEHERLVVYEGGYEIGMMEGMEKGMEKGIEKGRDDERSRIIAAMRSNGLSEEDIVRYTGVTK